MIGRVAAMAAAVVLGLGGAAQAKVLRYQATLNGHKVPTDTGSDATGAARIAVDTDAKTVDLSLDVTGITIDELWRQLVAAPIGPVHLHSYGGHDHSNPDASALILPVPMGPAYTATAKGFHVEVKGYKYDAGAALLHSTATFDDFLMSLQHGGIVLNIHTNTEHDGEISGEVVPAG